MSAEVTAAMISGGAALVVALLGIGGAIAAQLVATRRAFANSLALFERQHAADQESKAQERAKATRREEAQRFADERRLIYAKFLRLVRELRECHRVGADPNKEIEDQYVELRTQIDLLASEPVRAAAERLSDPTTLLAWQDYSDASDTFVDAARRELGMPPGSDNQPPADQDGAMLG
jgi:hypothetical protein